MECAVWTMTSRRNVELKSVHANGQLFNVRRTSDLRPPTHDRLTCVLAQVLTNIDAPALRAVARDRQPWRVSACATSLELKIDEPLEAAQEVDDVLVVGRQQLHENDGRDLLWRIDPEVRIEDAGPAQAAWSAHPLL